MYVRLQRLLALIHSNSYKYLERETESLLALRWRSTVDTLSDVLSKAMVQGTAWLSKKDRALRLGYLKSLAVVY